MERLTKGVPVPWVSTWPGWLDLAQSLNPSVPDSSCASASLLLCHCIYSLKESEMPGLRLHRLQMGAVLICVCVFLWTRGTPVVDAPLADPFWCASEWATTAEGNTLIDLTNQLWTLSTRGQCQRLRDQQDALYAYPITSTLLLHKLESF